MPAPQPTAIGAFELNVGDARLLVALARAMTNTRTRRMRKERRLRVASALDIPRKSADQLDCVESADFFLVLKPSTAVTRDALSDVRPLLRQALVAACAAVETYVADRTMELMKGRWRELEKPDRLLKIPMSVGDWFEIERKYERGAWGVRAVVQRHVREQASTAPSRVGQVLSIAGQKDVLNRVDGRRRLPKGTSAGCLEAITERRNLIAHTGDRSGRGRANITVEEVERDLENLQEIVEGLDAVTA